jgi:hypothetical protein
MLRIGVHDHLLAGDFRNPVDVVGIRQARFDVRVVTWMAFATKDVVGREEDDTRPDFGGRAGYVRGPDGVHGEGM